MLSELELEGMQYGRMQGCRWVLSVRRAQAGNMSRVIPIKTHRARKGQQSHVHIFRELIPTQKL